MPAADDEIGRAFLVGCPRSGTTLLQSLLFAHPEVVSFPETFFFVRAVPPPGLRRRLRLVGPEAPAALSNLRVAGLEPPPRSRLSRVGLAAYVRTFIDAADAAARRSGARVWVEKTPHHLRYVPEIERYVERAQIIHLVRSGPAVMASLRQVMRDHPDVWGSEKTVPELIYMWSGAVRLSARWAGRPNHSFVSYEQLVADAPRVLRKLCVFLGIRGGDETIELMLRDYRDKVDEVRGARTREGTITEEPWKAGAGEEIRDRNSDTLDGTFTSAELAEIEAAVAREQQTLARIPYL